MVIVPEGFGDHSNRLFQNLHLEAHCKEYNIRFSNPSLFNMTEYYNVDHKAKGALLLAIVRVLRKLGLITLFEIDSPEKQDLFVHQSKERKVLFVGGWTFRAYEATKKHQPFFSQKYMLDAKYYENNELLKKISDIDRKTRAVVGVHIRRGDYKTWADGKYFFEKETYLAYMESLSLEIAKNTAKQAIFILFSNEKIEIDEDKTILISKNEWFIDHLLMSKCDYLIGPPSTFTMWASYIGQNKFFHMRDTSGRISLADFSVCTG